MKSPMGLQAELPVADIVREALELLWVKRRPVVRLFLPVIAVLAVLDWADTFFLAQNDYLLRGGFMLVSVVLSVLFATTCHRFTLLPPEQQSDRIFRVWGRSEFRYLLRTFQIVLIGLLVFFSVMLGLMLALGDGNENALISALVAMLPACYLWARLSVTLPEVSMGRHTELRRAWDMSKGNGGKLVLVVIIVPLLMTAPFLLLYLADHSLLNYLASFGVYLSTLISLVMLSLSYRFLLEFFEPPESDIGAQALPSSDSDTNGFDA